MWEGMETLGDFPAERNKLENVCVCWGKGAGQEVLRDPVWVGVGVRVGPGQKAATSQATDAQCRRNVRLAKRAGSWAKGQH